MPIDRSIAREHANWLALVEVSGSFLSLPILMESFASGLDKRNDEEERELRRRLRLAYDEWNDNQAGNAPDPAIHQCTFHDSWARQQGSTLETRMRYTPSDCFETFPFPGKMDILNDIGQRYHTHRQSIVLTRQEGLTATYNRFHNPDEQSSDIIQLRALHKEMDEAVAQAYGWEDLALEHGFHETKQGLR